LEGRSNPHQPSPEAVRTDEETAMRSDSEIERDIRKELKWGPDLHAGDIAVSVRKGVVTLAGFVPSYTDRLKAEAAAKRLAGVCLASAR
jgi:osmotically-inducible protein OsmY